MRPFGSVYRDVGFPLGPYADVQGGRDEWIAVLLFGAIYVYLLQRTYPPGS
jgi:hypothetical protein